MKASEAMKHVQVKIAEAKLYNSPFTYFYVRDVFPDEYYSLILRNWPPREQFTDIEKGGRIMGNDTYVENSRLFIQGQQLSHLEGISSSAAEFWRSFSESFYGRDFNRYLFDLFKPIIKAQRHDLPSQFQLAPDGQLVQDYTHYSIGPHTDNPRRLISTLYYCPEDDSMSHLGTSLFVPKSKRVPLKISGIHRDFHDFKKVATAGYRPNCMFGFVVSPNSFHGVEPITDAGTVRRSILHYVKAIHGLH